MNKKQVIIFLFSVINYFIFCQDLGVTKIINNSKNKDLENLLKYSIKTNESPSKKFIFVYSICSIESRVFQKNEINKEKLKKTYKIDDFEFKKDESKWGLIYDMEKRKIIFKFSDLILFSEDKNMIIWDEKNGYFILSFPQGTLVEFYNIKYPEKKSFSIDVEKNYQFSENNKFIAYQSIIKSFHYDIQIVPAEIGIRIRDIEKGNDIYFIKPDLDNSILNIIKWESDNELFYKETNKSKDVSKEILFKLNDNFNNKYFIKKYLSKENTLILQDFPFNPKEHIKTTKISKSVKLEILTELIEKRTKFKKDECANCKWVLVKSDKGDIGYCLLDQLEPIKTNDKNLIIKLYKPTIDNLRFRETPTLDGKFIRLLVKDEKLELIEKGKEETVNGVKGTWLKVKTEKGEVGWAFDAYLKEIDR